MAYHRWRYARGMADQVEVKLSHPHDGHDVGDRLELDKVAAKDLVRAGVATFANKTEAKRARGRTATPPPAPPASSSAG